MTDTVLQPAWLLHYTNFRDTSFIVDMFTLGRGRVSLLARGARSSRSRSRALYQPFRPLLLSWVDNPHSELRTLTGLEDSGPSLDLDNRALACAYYLNELCLRLLGKEQPQDELFAHYGAALTRLGDSTEVEQVLRGFELQLLDTLGVLPDLAHCGPEGQMIDPGLQYRFFAANALAVPLHGFGGEASAMSSEGASSAQPLAGSTRSADDRLARRAAGRHADGVTDDSGVAVGGDTLCQLARFELPDESSRPGLAREARDVMRTLIATQLGGRPLRSRELFATLNP